MKRNTGQKKIKHRTNRPVRVKWIIFGCFTLFTILVIAVLWVFQTVFLDEFYTRIKINSLKTGAEIALTSGDTEALSSIAERYGISIRVWDDAFSEIKTAHGMAGSYIFDMSPHVLEQIYAATQNERGELYTVIQDQREPAGDSPFTRVIYSQITEEGNFILVETVISTTSGTVETLRVQLYWAMGVFLLLGLVFALFVSRGMSRPIEKINESAKKLAVGDYREDFPKGGYREISELSETLNHTARELARVEDLRKELIANVSHDLRTPLTMITAYAEMMRDIPGEQTPENIQVIIDESNHLTALVNDLLGLSALQSGEQTLDVQRYNLTDSINRILQRYKKLVDQEGFQIVFEHGEDVFVIADEMKISQVVYNLINNAVNYAGEDKMVVIRQIVAEDAVYVEVADHGEGIAKEQLPYIWDRYYKVDQTHRRSKVGSGIGLSIVKGIMEQHGGRYGVMSSAGKGSVFWFTLPIG